VAVPNPIRTVRTDILTVHCMRCTKKVPSSAAATVDDRLHATHDAERNVTVGSSV
jgi:hypothetical protein